MGNCVEIISPAKSVDTNCQPLFIGDWFFQHRLSYQPVPYFIQNITESGSVNSEGLLEPCTCVCVPHNIPLFSITLKPATCSIDCRPVSRRIQRQEQSRHAQFEEPSSFHDQRCKSSDLEPSTLSIS